MGLETRAACRVVSGRLAEIADPDRLLSYREGAKHIGHLVGPR